MYVDPNFTTKKALKEAVVAGEYVGIYDPGPFGTDSPTNGTVCVEGPHYPKPHKWYAQLTIVDSKITKVK